MFPNNSKSKNESTVKTAAEPRPEADPEIEPIVAVSQRHTAVSTDFTTLDDGDAGDETLADSLPSDMPEPLDKALRSGRIVGVGDVDLEASDDDIAQDTTDGTLPRE